MNYDFIKNDILEQMNRVSLMYLCVHDKVYAEKHKEEVAELQHKIDQTYREIRKSLEPYKDTDLAKLNRDKTLYPSSFFVSDIFIPGC